MKIGLSSYSLYRAMQAGEMTFLDAIEWVKEHGGEHIEIVPLGVDFTQNSDLVDAIREKAQEVGLDISNYAIGANFIKDTENDYLAEVERVKKEVDVANRLGVKLMRHDVVSRPIPQTSIQQFEEDLDTIVKACREIADYASQYGITTSVENHGYHVQSSDRVQRLVHAVNRPNYKTTLDVGNFMCADEESVSAVKNNISIASMVHLKDFYLRPAHKNPGHGWFPTRSGNFLRGAIIGQGDIDMWGVIKVIKDSGYDGYISIEFEGMEDCKVGSKAGLENARRIWNEV